MSLCPTISGTLLAAAAAAPALSLPHTHDSLSAAVASRQSVNESTTAAFDAHQSRLHKNKSLR